MCVRVRVCVCACVCARVCNHENKVPSLPVFNTIALW